MSLFCNWNGRIVEEDKVVISPNNRSFRYGDGCFETMKAINGEIILSTLHYQRLFSSLDTLKFSIPVFFTPAYIKSQVEELVKRNGHEQLARIRLVVFRGDGGLYDLKDNSLHFIIQSWAGKKDSNYFNETGFSVDIFQDARIAADLFSSIKSNNYLRYAMAAMSAKKKGHDDNILINTFNGVADATIANVFIVTNGMIQTPPLTEGCINGVMRKYLLQCFEKESLPFIELAVSVEELLSASEVFLTNANYGIRWIKTIGNSNYKNATSSFLHRKFVAPLFTGTTF